MILFFRAGENEDWKLFTISGNPVIVTLSESNGWSTSISGLPGECEYRMRELPLTGWDGSTWIDDGGTFTGGTDYQVSYNDQADSTTVTNTLKTNPDPDDGAKKITGSLRSRIFRHSGSERQSLTASSKSCRMGSSR